MTTRGDSPAAGLVRLPGIDFLRGLAIVLVVLHHTGLRIPLAASPLARWLPEAVVDTLMASGFEAAYVFFAISGFPIARHEPARRGTLDGLDVRAFYARRAVRILPGLVLLVVLLVVMRAGLSSAAVPHHQIGRPGQSIAGATAAAIGFHQLVRIGYRLVTPLPESFAC